MPSPEVISVCVSGCLSPCLISISVHLCLSICIVSISLLGLSPSL